MRSEDHIFASNQARVHFGFEFENIKGCAGDFLVFQGVGESRLVDNRAARGVHEIRSAFHFFQIVLRDQVTRVRKQGDVQADEIRLAEKAIAIDEFGVQLLLHFDGCADSVAIKDAHVESQRTARYAAPDAAKSQNAERFSPNIAAAKLIEIPARPSA